MVKYGNEAPSFVSAAPAQTSGGSGSSLLILVLPVLLIVWLFWTSSRRQKQMRQFSSSLNIGDQVITSAGIYGTIRFLDEQTAWIEVAEGTTLRVDRRAVAMKQPEQPTGVIQSDENPGQ
jgi:preprotein translocase subunit YajC